jgi:hypothetical protein
MKTHMEMLPNGNYEEVISPIQHKCVDKNYIFSCYEYSWRGKKLFLEIADGDPYEDGYNNEIEVKFCPFCGYTPS